MNLCVTGNNISLSTNAYECCIESVIFIPRTNIIIPLNEDIIQTDLDDNSPDKDTKIMSYMRSEPIMLLGGGGTGKTENMIEYMIEKSNTNYDNMYLYLAPSDSLSHWTSIRVLSNENLNPELYNNITFTSLSTLLLKLYYSRDHSPSFITREVFQCTYYENIPAIYKDKGADMLYDMLIGGHMPSKTLYDIYKSIKYENRHVDILDLCDKVSCNPKPLLKYASTLSHLYIDEIQDYTHKMWDVIGVILSVNTASLTCAGDLTQRLIDNMPSIEEIRQVAYTHIKKPMRILYLNKNYRSEGIIISLANTIQNYTSMRAHNMTYSKLPDPKTYVKFIEVPDMNINPSSILSGLGVPSKNFRLAIICTSAKWKHILESTIGNEYNIFSSYECKGLEFDLVVGWDLFNTSTNVKNSALRKHDFDDIYMNHIYVAVTRARWGLINIVPSEERTDIMKDALNVNTIHVDVTDSNFKPSPIIHIPTEQSSMNSDIRMAIIMRDRGLYQQALNIFTQYKATHHMLYVKTYILNIEYKSKNDDSIAQQCCKDVLQYTFDDDNDEQIKLNVQIRMAQMYTNLNNHVEACKIYNNIQDVSNVMTSVTLAIEKRSYNLIQLRYILEGQAENLWNKYNTNYKYGILVYNVYMLLSSIPIMTNMLRPVPHKIRLIMMHNVFIEHHQNVCPIWDMCHNKDSLLTWMDLAQMSRLNNVECDISMQYILSTFNDEYMDGLSHLLYLYIGPCTHNTILVLTEDLKSKAIKQLYSNISLDIESVSVKYKELSCPFNMFLMLYNCVSNDDKIKVLIEAYKIHTNVMRGTDFQLILFKWCYDLCQGHEFIETIVTVLHEDPATLNGVFDSYSTKTPTHMNFLKVFNRR